MPQAVKVGIFATLALAVLGFLILKVEDLELFGEPGRQVSAVFDSVAGLDDKSAVRVAGVRVGRVDGIALQGGRAVVTLLLDRPVDLRQGATAAIANLGILGDKYVVLDPGPADAPPLGDGEILLGTAPPSFDDAMAQLSDLAGSLQETMGSVTGGPGGSAIRRLLDSLEATSGEIGRLVADNRRQISATVGNFSEVSGTLAAELPRLTAQMERLLAEIETVVTENRGDLRETMSAVRDATEGIRVSVDNLNTISSKLAAGEGTIGKLLNSDETHDALVSTLGTIESGVQELSSTLGQVKKFRLDLGFDSYYLDAFEDTRTAFNVTVDPQTDKFYYLEVVDDPRGRVRSRTDVTDVTLPDGTMQKTTVRRISTDDEVTLSAQFGFKIGAAGQGRLRAGLFESSGGAAVDYAVADKRLQFSLEAFDFGREAELDPHLRFTTRFRLTPHVFLLGGVDDFLESDRESIFFGGAIRWSDDDLKYLLGALPSSGF